MGLGVIILCLVAHVYAGPFKNGVLDRLDAICLINLAIYIYSGVCFYSDTFPDQVSIVLLVSLGLTVSCAVYFTQINIRETQSRETAERSIKKLLHQVAENVEYHPSLTSRLRLKFTKSPKTPRFGPISKSDVQGDFQGELFSTLAGYHLGDFVQSKSFDREALIAFHDMDAWLSPACGDESDMSTFCFTDKTSFYRKLAASLPELIDWFALAPDREHTAAKLVLSSWEKFIPDRQRGRTFAEAIVLEDQAPVLHHLVTVKEDHKREAFSDLMARLVYAHERSSRSQRKRRLAELGGRVLPFLNGPPPPPQTMQQLTYFPESALTPAASPLPSPRMSFSRTLDLDTAFTTANVSVGPPSAQATAHSPVPDAQPANGTTHLNNTVATRPFSGLGAAHLTSTPTSPEEVEVELIPVHDFLQLDVEATTAPRAFSTVDVPDAKLWPTEDDYE